MQELIEYLLLDADGLALLDLAGDALLPLALLRDLLLFQLSQRLVDVAVLSIILLFIYRLNFLARDLLLIFLLFSIIFLIALLIILFTLLLIIVIFTFNLLIVIIIIFFLLLLNQLLPSDALAPVDLLIQLHFIFAAFDPSLAHLHGLRVRVRLPVGLEVFVHMTVWVGGVFHVASRLLLR